LTFPLFLVNLTSMRNSFYFGGGFAGWFYFSPVSWRVRLR
jgi:hypothetical protein